MAPDAKRARWMDYLERVNPGYLRTRELGNSYNDWLAPADDKTPHELLAGIVSSPHPPPEPHSNQTRTRTTAMM
jgi:hypothetical protein